MSIYLEAQVSAPAEEAQVSLGKWTDSESVNVTIKQFMGVDLDEEITIQVDLTDLEEAIDALRQRKFETALLSTVGSLEPSCRYDG